MRAAGEAQGKAPLTVKSGVKRVVTPAFCQKNVTGKKGIIRAFISVICQRRKITIYHRN
jgi:hypothetical protein